MPGGCAGVSFRQAGPCTPEPAPARCRSSPCICRRPCERGLAREPPFPAPLGLPRSPPSSSLSSCSLTIRPPFAAGGLQSTTGVCACAAAANLLGLRAKVHNRVMFEWDDIKYFLAVARHGSTLAAARALRLSQSTVQRRVAELERKLGRELVKRHATGYRLTEFGEEM